MVKIRGRILAQGRRTVLAVGEVYHIFTKSIAGYKIFNNEAEFDRIIATFQYYQRVKPDLKFSKFIKSSDNTNSLLREIFPFSNDKKLVEIIAYCVMPTHVHFILKQVKKNGISNFMSHTLNSYTRYFNIRHRRKGPLWQGRFKSVFVESEEQLLHLTRYIHLNPVTSFLVDRPENWLASSYLEYVSGKGDNGLCDYKDLLEIKPSDYKKFVMERSSYQRDLQVIKNLIFD